MPEEKTEEILAVLCGPDQDAQVALLQRIFQENAPPEDETIREAIGHLATSADEPVRLWAEKILSRWPAGRSHDSSGGGGEPDLEPRPESIPETFPETFPEPVSEPSSQPVHKPIPEAVPEPHAPPLPASSRRSRPELAAGPTPTDQKAFHQRARRAPRASPPAKLPGPAGEAPRPGLSPISKFLLFSLLMFSVVSFGTYLHHRSRDTQKRFVAALAAIRDQGAKADTPDGQSEVRTRRTAVVKEALAGRSGFRGWTGTVEECTILGRRDRIHLSVIVDEPGLLGGPAKPSSVRIRTHRNPFSDLEDHTLVPAESPLFKTAEGLKPGDRVRVTGDFVGDRQEFILEGTVDAGDSLRAPQFIARFSELERIKP